jgi:zinc transporter, ZIP family
MAAGGASSPLPTPRRRAQTRVWLLGLLPLGLIGAAVAVLASVGAPGLGERRGPPIENLAVERTVLRPGQIELTVRNDGPDPVRIAQVIVNDAFVDFRPAMRGIGHLATATVTIAYPWVEGEAYELRLLTSTGATIAHEVPLAVETPAGGASLLGLMALLGTYVGLLPVLFGMLWLPWLRRLSEGSMRALMALTIGLLLFLAVDASLEGLETASEGSQALGGPGLVFLGAIASYVAISSIDAHLRSKRQGTQAEGTYLALLVAIGIGLHNLGEGLAVGAAYASGALGLGALLVIGFALHNTTEGLAIVAPVARQRPSIARLGALGAVAGAPAILGAWIGTAAAQTSLFAFLLGAGVGAIAQVVQQLAPLIRNRQGRYLHPRSAAGLVGGLAILYATGLLISA